MHHSLRGRSSRSPLAVSLGAAVGVLAAPPAGAPLGGAAFASTARASTARASTARASTARASTAPGGNWGLTQVTAHDEMTLLGLLTSSNSVPNSASGSYALG